MQSKAKTVAEYLQSLPSDRRAAIAAVREVLRYYGVKGGADNGDFSTSPDNRNFAAWRGDKPKAPRTE